jgi:hypothetical protein
VSAFPVAEKVGSSMFNKTWLYQASNTVKHLCEDIENFLNGVFLNYRKPLQSNNGGLNSNLGLLNSNEGILNSNERVLNSNDGVLKIICGSLCVWGSF